MQKNLLKNLQSKALQWLHGNFVITTHFSMYSETYFPPQHRNFLNTALEVLPTDQRILGVAAGGSLLTNSLDDYSDLDLIIVIDPSCYEEVMIEKEKIAKGLGSLLNCFTGEHADEPRLLICLYGPPLIHIDLKFVSLNDLRNRVEDPAILWERNQAISNALSKSNAKFPQPDLQWIEDRFWTWIHYGTTKLARGELFEVIESLSFLRTHVFGPLIAMKHKKPPRGVRRIEQYAPESSSLLKKTLARHNYKECKKALEACAFLYQELRESYDNENLIKNHKTERAVFNYMKNALDDSN